MVEKFCSLDCAVHWRVGFVEDGTRPQILQEKSGQKRIGGELFSTAHPPWRQLLVLNKVSKLTSQKDSGVFMMLVSTLGIQVNVRDQINILAGKLVKNKQCMGPNEFTG
jgi:hypothetical protein